MASESNLPRRSRRTRTRQRVEGDDHVDDVDPEPSTSQTDTPSKTRLANIPKEAIEKAYKSLRKIIFSNDDDEEIRSNLDIVRAIVKGTLQQDPEQKENLESEEQYRANVTREGEKDFIDSLRTMAANSDTQGSKAWDDLFENGTSFSLGPRI